MGKSMVLFAVVRDAPRGSMVSTGSHISEARVNTASLSCNGVTELQGQLRGMSNGRRRPTSDDTFENRRTVHGARLVRF